MSHNRRCSNQHRYWEWIDFRRAFFLAIAVWDKIASIDLHGASTTADLVLFLPFNLGWHIVHHFDADRPILSLEALNCIEQSLYRPTWVKTSDSTKCSFSSNSRSTFWKLILLSTKNFSARLQSPHQSAPYITIVIRVSLGTPSRKE